MSNKNVFKKMPSIGERTDVAPRFNHGITDYFKIKQQSCKVKKKAKDVARITPLTDLITSRRHQDNANSILIEQRGHMVNWNIEMNGNWQQLEERQLQLRDSFLRFNEFIIENHDKRTRADNKIKKEEGIQFHLNAEIQKIQDQLKYLKAIEKDLDEKVKEYKIYKDFLSKAVKQSADFSDIQDILSRYEILAGTRSELGEHQATALASVQEKREQLTHAAGEQMQIIMELHTELAALRVRKDLARSLVSKWDSLLSNARAFAAEKAIEIQQVQNSCWDLYKTMCNLRREPVSAIETDTEHQLAYISRRIQELAKVTSIVHKKSERHTPASIRNTATSSI